MRKSLGALSIGATAVGGAVAGWAVLGVGQRRKLIDAAFALDPRITRAIIAVSDAEGEVLLESAQGQQTQDDPFVLASVTKLYTHALIFQLIDDGLLDYELTLGELLEPELWQGINVYRGEDMSGAITVRQLLDATSGLADYESDAGVMKRVIEEDLTLSVAEAVELTRACGGRSLPGAKAHYSNLNADLLGQIATKVTETALPELFERHLFEPLQLTDTYLAQPAEPIPSFWYGRREMQRPNYLASQPASGGLISTNAELQDFLRAFFTGQLFDIQHLQNLNLHPIQFRPLSYGAGMMSMAMPRWASPFMPTPRILGHSGATGSFAFYEPEGGRFISGTINQVKVHPFSWLYAYLGAAGRSRGN
ncbi:serine hydrolase domain-containing protein [Corynebacterium sp. A21]|uniref:serine hydrolase domain-containing protein n=1 Tax=Corynebacterium sp. A21 TaxID=3457318 RepID=UPI003FD3614B